MRFERTGESILENEDDVKLADRAAAVSNPDAGPLGRLAGGEFPQPLSAGRTAMISSGLWTMIQEGAVKEEESAPQTAEAPPAH